MYNKIQLSALKPLLKYIDNQEVQEINIHTTGEVDLTMIDDSVETLQDEELTASALEDFLVIFSIETGKRYSSTNSVMSFAIFGKHRVSVIGGEYSKGQPLISIRPKRNKQIGLERFGLSQKEIDDLKIAVENKRNILIIGSTRQGKTTFLNALMRFIPPKNRVFTIENVEEIEVPKTVRHLNTFYKERHTSADIESLIDEILRQSPNRIIFGELRIDNTIHFAACLKKGHSGTMATIHANNPQTVFDTMRQNIEYQTKGGGGTSFTEGIEKEIDIAVVISRIKNDKGNTEIKASITDYSVDQKLAA